MLDVSYLPIVYVLGCLSKLTEDISILVNDG